MKDKISSPILNLWKMNNVRIVRQKYRSLGVHGCLFGFVSVFVVAVYMGNAILVVYLK